MAEFNFLKKLQKDMKNEQKNLENTIFNTDISEETLETEFLPTELNKEENDCMLTVMSMDRLKKK